jgi:hypothetical protein
VNDEKDLVGRISKDGMDEHDRASDSSDTSPYPVW